MEFSVNVLGKSCNLIELILKTKIIKDHSLLLYLVNRSTTPDVMKDLPQNKNA